MNDLARHMSDDELLTALGASFPVEPAEPDAAQLLRLSLAVAELRQPKAPDTAAAGSAARPSRWTLPRRLSPVALAGAVVGVVGAGTGISFAVGAPIPAAVRSIVRSVGLDKPATPSTLPAATAPPARTVSTVRQAESTLHQALTESNPPRSVISHDSTVLAHQLVRLGGHPVPGAAGTTADGRHLLNEACQHLVGSGQTGAGTATTHAGGGGTTFPGCGPVGIWRYPSGPTGSSSSLPTTTGTTELPSPSHPGAGTHGGPIKAPGGRSSGAGTHSGRTRTGGVTPTGGSKGTTRSPTSTPATFPGDSSGGSPGGRSGGSSGHGTSSGQPASPQTHGTTTNPRSAPPPTN